MRWFKRTASPASPDRIAFRQCPGCMYDFLTGEGARGCNWYDCPYLPEELTVCCPVCNYNFATGEGSAPCGDPPSCVWAAESPRRVEAARERFGGAT
jgi:hypothetical protein